ncbi:hypothetical protein M404DRAFT_996436 [Pisolithus tinctorius Marx 270]|uniref:Uncharacterized protein n=1 Tax=Pisolithus tinctorius Marx 270 TaxID=870435 RepID=A0A0C3JKD7_PISTI|nr:hypothetical protein M404DRAFT_996436 [Pisolithus tinctorius Marx 270]
MKLVAGLGEFAESKGHSKSTCQRKYAGALDPESKREPMVLHVVSGHVHIASCRLHLRVLPKER